MGFRKKAKLKEDEKDIPLLTTKSVEQKDSLSAPAASIRQLYRFASWTDIILVVIGCIVAVITGLGLPLMAIAFGDTSKVFIEYESAKQNTSVPDYDGALEAARQHFDHEVVDVCLNYLYIGILIMVCALIQVNCFMISCENICNRMRREFFMAIQRQDIAWFDTNQSGTLATKLFDSIERVREGTGDKMGLMIQCVAQFFGGIAIAFFYHWQLTLIMMSLTPVLVISGAIMAKMMASATAQEAKKYSVAGKIAEEALTSIKTVLSFNGQEGECKRYDAVLESGKVDGIKKAFYIGFGMAFTSVIIFSSYCLAFWIGTDYIYWGLADSKNVLTVFFAVMMGSMALGQAGPQLAILGTALGSAGVVIQIIDRVPEIDCFSKDGKKPANVTGKIEVSNLRFTYPSRKDVQVLKGLSFTANPGETIALVGSSGCGKSTIVQLLLRYYNPESGTISIDGIPIEEYNIEYLRQTVGVVSQEPVLFNTTILENIRYGNPDATDGQINSALKKANALTFINSFPQGLNTIVGDRGAQMSGGQKQRIAIARALLRDPKILLLDEATSALDAESEGMVQEALENASQGRTTLVIAHRLSTIRNASKIVAMKAGEVVETGTHAELLTKKGLYYELVNSQVFADVDETKSPKKTAVSKRRSRRISTTSHTSVDNKKGDTDSSSGDEEDALAIPENEKDIDRLKRELKEEGAIEANLFKILKYAKTEWIYLVFGTIACIIQGGVFPMFSVLFTQIMQVFSEIDREKMRSDGHLWALMFLVLAAVQAITVIGQYVLYGIAAERLTMKLRSKVFRNVMRQDGAYFDMPSHSPGKISTRLATDAPNVKSAIDHRFGAVFNSIVALVAGLSIAFYYGWQMTLMMLALFPFLAGGKILQTRLRSGRSAQDAKEMESSGKVVMEAIESIRTVQALTLQNKLHEKFCSFLDGPHNAAVRKAFIQGCTYATAVSLMFFVLAAEFRFGGWLVVENHVANPIDVMRVIFAIQFSSSSLGYAAAYLPEYLKAKFAAGLIFKMLGEKPVIDNMTKGGKTTDIRGAITLDDVHFTYPQRTDVPILKGMSFAVNPGETLALVGPSGCGKSTVIQLLERFYNPTDGSLKVDGEDVREINPVHLRSHMALVSQEPTLFDMSIKENIMYGLPEGTVDDSQVIAAAKKANIHTFVSELPDGYETTVGDKGAQLSGGQKQRVAIARALVRNPRILLLDEATSALDVESEKLVQEALDAASEGRTCIVIAHRLSTVVNANCILVVKGGNVIEKGTHNELMALRGAYFALTLKQQTKSDETAEELE